ncbi:MAG: hypothetical protein KGH55_03050 [Nanoarchaeota archaeon]|nr:hypothetical protein [Nanoarchaeota archaeon]
MKIKKRSLATFLMILGVIVLAGIIIYMQARNLSGSSVSADLARCIGQHSAIYVQLGCSHCADQEAMFGGSWKYMNSTDCYYNPQECNLAGIQYTPTWIINNTRYVGVQSVDELKNLTGC